MAGTLFVVATPIGNLEDLTFRALRTLQSVDAVAAEDTRRTSKLLAHYRIAKPLLTLHEHNEGRETPKLLKRMQAGESIALVSDAGTPAISDPGTTLVRAARDAGVAVVPIPGPSAITAALSVSGIPATPFLFLGFPPSSGAARDRWFERAHQAECAVIFFEAPHRIRRTIEELQEYTGNRPITVNREISKINENFVEWASMPGTAAGPELELAAQIPERGEFVVVVGPRQQSAPVSVDDHAVVRLFDQLSASDAVGELNILVTFARILNMSEPSAARLIKKARISVKRQTSPEHS